MKLRKTDNLESIKIVLFLHFFKKRECHERDIGEKYTSIQNVDDGIGSVIFCL